MPDNGGPKEQCRKPFENAPIFHLMDQRGCDENDPNGPVFDPVHGVIHHFYQIHLAAAPGHGPDYGHFVSKDFVTWANLPTAIWNGYDSSTTPLTVTPYDNEAIFTGSAVVVDGAGPGGKGKGIIQIYPGLCNKNDWPNCSTGTLLAQAVPAAYAADELLTNWTKPSYNPIVENTQRDPSTPWKTPLGEWRLRTYDSMVYGAASDADLVAGKWYTIGKSATLRTCECPSVYDLPPATPGFEEEYERLRASGALPTTVHKTSCGGDWWQLGDYAAGAVRTTGNFTATRGWEDLFEQRKIDQGQFYASKDSLYPTKGSDALRRINWGWATVPPGSAQSLPREITFNPVARVLEQAPIAELTQLRGAPAASLSDVSIPSAGFVRTSVPKSVGKYSELVATFALPTSATSLAVTMGSAGVTPFPSAGALSCSLQFSAEAVRALQARNGNVDVPCACGGRQDKLTLTPRDKTLEVRVFTDATFFEVFFQNGRVAITVGGNGIGTDEDTDYFLSSTHASVSVASAVVYPMKSIWVDADAVRQQPRVYGA